jgi:hypothetical protein
MAILQKKRPKPGRDAPDMVRGRMQRKPAVTCRRPRLGARGVGRQLEAGEHHAYPPADAAVRVPHRRSLVNARRGAAPGLAPLGGPAQARWSMTLRLVSCEDKLLDRSPRVAGMRIKPQLDQATIVLVGRFNPAIFQPAWFALHKMLGQKEAESAENQAYPGRGFAIQG